jgi:solute carrier family 45 protein 1/2/4
MPSTARWVGTPKVKGSSDAMRMALLTASLIGLQYVNGFRCMRAIC